MQNIGHPQMRGEHRVFQGFLLSHSRARQAFFLFVVCLCVSVVALAAQPGAAYAKSYDMPQVDIAAQVNTDGSLHVTEQRTFEFKGDFTAVWFVVNPPFGGELKVNSVQVSDPALAAAGQAATPVALKETSFDLKWRDAGGPGVDSYSVDAPKNTTYVFLNVSDASRVITIDYTVTNAIGAYKDVGELYWQYVGTAWEEVSRNVAMTVSLPVPVNTVVTPGENVRAWGHGPLDGKIAVGTDGVLSYQVAQVNAGQYAEARAVFPVAWLTNIPAKTKALHQDEMRLDQVLADEKNWADQANQQRTTSLVFVIACGIIAVLVLVWALLMFARYGREHKPSFADPYWRDVPSPAHHPAEMGRLWRWDKESQDDFVATIMHLSHVGALRINQGSHQVKKAFGTTKTVDDYSLTRVDSVADTLKSPLDVQAMELLFGTISSDGESLWMGSIKEYGKDNPEAFLEAMSAWQGALSAAIMKDDFFEAKGQKLQVTMAIVAAVLLVCGVGAFFFMNNFFPLIFAAPVAVIVFVLSNFMPRRSQDGVDLNARCEALRNWLKDFSSLDERPPTDVKVWGEFMVYAYLFGVADQAIKNLKNTVPEIFEADGTMASSVTYVPWWFWYSPAYGASGSVMPAASDFLGSAMESTASTAAAALSAAQDNFSSGGGMGGGFSMGGGGGFGGGGGAR
ncbi:MAG: DUF2207 domain-containing protein [Raoultibacter sp.]